MNNIRKIRENKKMSQSSVARELGVSRQAYYNYETGKREADYETLLKIAEILDSSVDELISGREYKQAVAIEGSDLLSPEELQKAQEFIKFLISQRNNGFSD